MFAARSDHRSSPRRSLAWRAAVVVASVLAVTSASLALGAAPAAASPVSLTSDGWVWAFAAEGGPSLFQSVTPQHTNILGTGLTATGWTAGEGIGFPEHDSFGGTFATWGASTVVMSGETATVTTSFTSSAYGAIPVTVTILGGMSTWSWTDPDQFIIDGEWLYIDGNKFDSTAVPQDADLSAPSFYQIWSADAGESSSLGLAFRLATPTQWVVYDATGSPGDSLYYIPNGPAAPQSPGGAREVTMATFDSPPCASTSRVSALAASAAVLPTAPTDTMETDALDCGSLGSTSVSANSIISKTVPLTLPSGVTAAGYLTDPSQVHAVFSGLPAGVSAHLVSSAASLSVTLTGSATTVGSTVADVILYRRVVGRDTTTNIDPVIGAFTIGVTPGLAATGSSSPEPMGVAGFILLLLGVAAIGIARRIGRPETSVA